MCGLEPPLCPIHTPLPISSVRHEGSTRLCLPWGRATTGYLSLGHTPAPHKCSCPTATGVPRSSASSSSAVTRRRDTAQVADWSCLDGARAAWPWAAATSTRLQSPVEFTPRIGTRRLRPESPVSVPVTCRETIPPDARREGAALFSPERFSVMSQSRDHLGGEVAVADRDSHAHALQLTLPLATPVSCCGFSIAGD